LEKKLYRVKPRTPQGKAVMITSIAKAARRRQNPATIRKDVGAGGETNAGDSVRAFLLSRYAGLLKCH
jgi:hypothetical protein